MQERLISDLVDAQQARRVLDRIVGYRISPLLWAKVKRGLSAGRVQSVALRIIADREEEINAFIPEEYWTLDANLKVEGEKKLLRAKFYGKGNKKTDHRIQGRDGADIKRTGGGRVYSRRDPQRRKRSRRLRYLLQPVLCSRRRPRL